MSFWMPSSVSLTITSEIGRRDGMLRCEAWVIGISMQVPAYIYRNHRKRAESKDQDSDELGKRRPPWATHIYARKVSHRLYFGNSAAQEQE